MRKQLGHIHHDPLPRLWCQYLPPSQEHVPLLTLSHPTDELLAELKVQPFLRLEKSLVVGGVGCDLFVTVESTVQPLLGRWEEVRGASWRVDQVEVPLVR